MKFIFRIVLIPLIIFSFLLSSLSFIPAYSHDYEKNIYLKTSEPDYWPTSSWKASSPEDQGMSVQKLQEMEDYISDNNLNFDSILVIRNGYLIHESYPSHIYDQNDKHHIYSCTKVFTSALIGIALEEGLIGSIDDKVLEYFPEKTFNNMDSRKQSLTIRQLLTMTSGIEWIDQINYYEMAGTVDWVQYILDQPMEHQPGSVWNYNTGCSHLLSAILDRLSPSGFINYLKTKLFDPLNITNYSWMVDNQGIPIGGTLLYVTPRDMAKFGFLYLHDGYWNGSQLVPSEWISESATSFMNVEFDRGHGSGYGYQWWIYKWLNSYTARGSYEQYITVIPDLKMVVISTANSGNFGFINLIVDYILPSAGFTPFNYLLFTSIFIVSVSVCAITAFLFFRIRKKTSIRKLKEKYLNDVNQEEDKIS